MQGTQSKDIQGDARPLKNNQHSQTNQVKQGPAGTPATPAWTSPWWLSPGPSRRPWAFPPEPPTDKGTEKRRPGGHSRALNLRPGTHEVLLNVSEILPVLLQSLLEKAGLRGRPLFHLVPAEDGPALRHQGRDGLGDVVHTPVQRVHGVELQQERRGRLGPRAGATPPRPVPGRRHTRAVWEATGPRGWPSLPPGRGIRTVSGGRPGASGESTGTGQAARSRRGEQVCSQAHFGRGGTPGGRGSAGRQWVTDPRAKVPWAGGAGLGHEPSSGRCRCL